MCFNVQPRWKTTVWTNQLSPPGTGPDACENFGFCWPERRQMELGLGRSSIVAVTANPTSRSQTIWNTGQENIQGKERKGEGGNKKTYTMARKCLPGRVAQCIVYKADGLWEREGRMRATGQQPRENTPREMKGLWKETLLVFRFSCGLTLLLVS